MWETAYATIGVGICWDQWFPEAARAMMLQGAEFLFYPTAIGWHPCWRGTNAARLPAPPWARPGSETMEWS